ncbi:MAG TPA: hypothetical protein VI389_00665, partial [Geobacteraceae bacterium]
MMTNSPVISTLEPSRYHDSFGGVDDLLEQLDNALAREEGELRLYRLIDALSACAQRELLDEEEAMKWASYPSLEFHRAKHRFFVGEIGKLKSLSLSKQMQ